MARTACRFRELRTLLCRKYLKVNVDAANIIAQSRQRVADKIRSKHSTHPSRRLRIGFEAQMKSRMIVTMHTATDTTPEY